VEKPKLAKDLPPLRELTKEDYQQIAEEARELQRKFAEVTRDMETLPDNVRLK
jgi:archaellum component FlaC